jgi:hypothetical protein
LQKHNDELGRKLKEAEKQLAVLGWVVIEFFADVRSENERLVEDLQEKLEETRAEIAQKRKDEKELKSKDRAQLIQIAGVSPLVTSITDDSLKRISWVCRGLWSRPRRITPTCKTCITASVVSDIVKFSADRQRRHSDYVTCSRSEMRRLTDSKMLLRYMKVKNRR